MECSRCGFGKELEQGKHRGMAFEKSPCASCTLKESSLFTKAYDPKRETAAAVPSAPAVDGVEWMPVTVMEEVVALILRLPPAVRDAVCLRHIGLSYADIGDRLGVSPAAVEVRVSRAMKKNPELKALFRRKANKALRRKPHTRRLAA